jgi:hypothetical protein
MADWKRCSEILETNLAKVRETVAEQTSDADRASGMVVFIFDLSDAFGQSLARHILGGEPDAVKESVLGGGSVPGSKMVTIQPYRFAEVKKTLEGLFPGEAQRQPRAGHMAVAVVHGGVVIFEVPFQAADGLLQKDNWRDALIEAIRELPQNLQDCINHEFHPEGDVATIAIAAEAACDEGQTEPHKVEVRSWNTLREHGWDESHDHWCGPDWDEAEENWPVLSIENKATRKRETLHIGHAPVPAFRGLVQLTLLEALHSAHVVCKDARGCYTQKDETKILIWQKGR